MKSDLPPGLWSADPGFLCFEKGEKCCAAHSGALIAALEGSRVLSDCFLATSPGGAKLVPAQEEVSNGVLINYGQQPIV